jgi:hypothetical protein
MQAIQVLLTQTKLQTPLHNFFLSFSNYHQNTTLESKIDFKVTSRNQNTLLALFSLEKKQTLPSLMTLAQFDSISISNYRKELEKTPDRSHSLLFLTSLQEKVIPYSSSRFLIQLKKYVLEKSFFKESLSLLPYNKPSSCSVKHSNWLTKILRFFKF